MKRFVSLLLVCCLLAALTACGAPYIDPGPQQDEPTPPPRGTGPAPREETALQGLRAATSYAEIYAELNTGSGGALVGGTRFDDMEAGVTWDAMPMEPEASVDSSENVNSSATDKGHSDTNVQVAGIDEGDIVKTDGSFIYVLRAQDLIIFKADGTATTEVFRKTVGKSDWKDNGGIGGAYKGATSTERHPLELYVAEDRLVVVSSYYHWSESVSAAGERSDTNENRLEAEIYDISDPAQTSLIATVGQDGSYSASRMMDGTLYLISNHWTGGERTQDDPGSFVPALYRDGKAEILPCECIWLPEVRNGSVYTVVTAIGTEDGAQRASLSMLGGGSTVYMSHDDLYLVWQHGGETVSEPRVEGVYTITDYSYASETEIVRISLDGGLTVAASASVDGYLINQFALDAYDGYLRLVTTSSGHSYTIYEDKAMGFINHVWPDETKLDTNNLFVLDENLKVVGSITGLAEDERVYSVRFDGEIGYFVTFRQTDPLFAVDLSDPTAPKILSALKIPGFSQYLHVYGEGRLFGLGMHADEETGWTECMKLSMFDTSDPANVTEKHTLLLDSYWSEALHNHKAILIAPDKDIIAFPSEDGYLVYGYSDAQGFYLRAEIKESGDLWWYGNARGLYIGDWAYVVTDNQLWILDLEQLTLAQTIAF